MACILIATAAAALLPYTKASALRQRRDVSELSPPAYEYLPPAVKFAIPAAVETSNALPLELDDTEIDPEVVAAPEETVVLGDNGYEYKTVRRLKYRSRTSRDVSHLAREYLPPSNDYLPPKNAEAAETPVTEEEPQINEVAPPRIASEYLPPAAEETPQLDEDTVEVEAASAAPRVSTEYLPPNAEVVESEVEPALEDQIVTDAPTVAETEAPAAIVKSSIVEEAQEPEESAILAEDGYHYKQPKEVPTELKLDAIEEYLPPVADESGVDGDDAIVVDGPEESAILTKDGYHYRAVKRLRF